MRISGISLGIGSRENSVHKNKSANNLSTKTITLGVSRIDGIGSTTKNLVLMSLEPLNHTCPTYGAQALHYHVE